MSDAPKTILVVEDDKDAAEMLAFTLIDMGYEVIVSLDAMQGSTMALRKKPHLIILDYMMPAGGGKSVYETLRRNINTMRIPILFYTALTETKIRAELEIGSRTSFLPKPFKHEELESFVKAMLEGRDPKVAVSEKPAGSDDDDNGNDNGDDEPPNREPNVQVV